MAKPSVKPKSKQQQDADRAGINPAYVAAGVAGAGLGAAAVEQHEKKKHQPTLIENIGTGVVSAMDGVAGAAGTAIGTIAAPLHPLFMGGIALSMFIHPMARGVDHVAGTKVSTLTGKAEQAMQTVQGTTFAQLGEKIGATGVGKSIGSGIKSAAEFSAPLLNTASKLPGLGGLHSQHIKNAPEVIANTSVMHAAMRTAWVGGAALGTYGVARNFGSQLYALRQLQADLTGKDIDDVSSYQVLMESNLPKPVLEARDKLLKVSGIHAVAATAGLAMALKSHLIDGKLMKMMGGFGQGMLGGALAMMAYQIPEQIATIAEGFIGAPILAHYSGLRDAQESGMTLPPEVLVDFILAADEKLRNRGSVGKEYALGLAQQYAQEGTKVAGILNEMSDGHMQARLDVLIEERQKRIDAQATAKPKEHVSHVDRLLKSKAQPRPEVGEFTQKLNKQQASSGIAPTTQSL